MPSISVVVITFNEERNIARCLESVTGIADDIVVVDSYSTDNTAEIARQFGARVVLHKFPGYVEQKNYAITQAKYPHILSLDADEALSEDLRESILRVKQNWTHDGYYFNRLTFYCGKWIRHGSWYPSRKLRLWDSRKGSWKGLNPHDRFRMYPDTPIRYLKGDLMHYSYHSLNEHLNQITRFTEIIARAYYNVGRKSGLLRILFSPPWRFFRDYFIKLGVLDGYFGFIIACNSAYETFLKYVKLRQIILEEGLLPRNRICFINSTKSWGGGEKWHHDMAIHLTGRGKDVAMITNKRSELYKRIRNHPVSLHKISISNLSFLNFIKIFRIALLLRRERIKTVILNLSIDLKTAGISAKLAGVEKIIYRRGLAVPVKNSFYNRFLFRNIVTGVIANSEETKRTILLNNRNLVEEEKIRIIYNGIEIPKRETLGKNPQCGKRGDRFIIGNAGRLSPQKGQEYLIDLACELERRSIDYTILIAGTGELEARLKSYAAGKGVAEKVKFLGFVEDMKAFHQSIDVFILTSRFEGFGFVLVEAMAMCKPVIAFDVSNIPEIIEDRVSGYLIKLGDINMLADRVEHLFHHPTVCAEIGENARKRVEQHFELNRCVDQVEDFIGS